MAENHTRMVAADGKQRAVFTCLADDPWTAEKAEGTRVRVFHPRAVGKNGRMECPVCGVKWTRKAET